MIPSPTSPTSYLPCQTSQNSPRTSYVMIHNIIALIFTGILMMLVAITSWLCGFSLPITLPYIVFGLIILAIGYAWLISYKCACRKQDSLSTLEIHPSTPLPSPQPIELFPTQNLLRIPTLSELKGQPVSYMLNTHFHHFLTEPKGLIKSTTRLVTITNNSTGKQLNFFRGHPSDDSSIKVPRSAILIFTNSSKEYGLAVGRTLAVTALIDKSCWAQITGDSSVSFSPGSIAIGPWIRSAGNPPASHLIIMNPLSLEHLVDLRQERRAITFRDFCHRQAFIQLVNMYQQCFFQCQQEGITALQIECLGLTNLGECQEEYPQWEAMCQLALLEAVRLLESTHPLTCVTINHQKSLPFLKALQNAFN